MPEEERPEVLLSSPYIRARQTAEAICNAGGLAGGAKPTIIDERLREREFGVFDGLTTLGIREQYPDGSRRIAPRWANSTIAPPGGESWADVILRLRSVLNTINLHYADRRVLVVCHQVVVLCMRYILEELSEGQILAIDKQAEVLNCGICAYDFEPDDEQHLRAEARACGISARRWKRRATPQTAEPDVMTGHAMSRCNAARPQPSWSAIRCRRSRTATRTSHGPAAGHRRQPRDRRAPRSLAANAAMRAGAGKVSIATVASVAPQLAHGRCPKRWSSALPRRRDGGFARSAVARLGELAARFRCGRRRARE